MTIGVSELQRNISIIRNLTESLQVVDKKTNEVLATILPAKKKRKKQTLTDKLENALPPRKLPEKYRNDLDAAIADAYGQAVIERYRRSNEAG